jgi:glutathione peroxidase
LQWFFRQEARMGVHHFTLNNIEGKPKSLADYKGKVLLMVNTASECGSTPQYKGLEALHQKYKGQGLAVLGFPANNFGAQEPGTEQEIKAFCERNYGVTFDLFAKLEAAGDQISPLYKYLTTESGFDGPVKWNFAKFLADKDGKVIARFDTKVEPDDPELVDAVEKALKS